VRDRRSTAWQTVGLAALCAIGFCGCPTDDPLDDDVAPVEPGAIDADRMWDDLQYLASDELAGRAPTTVGNDAAVDAVEAVFEEAGLVPMGDTGFRQHFPYLRWEQDLASVALGAQELTEGEDFRVFDYSGSGNVTEEMVFAGYGLTVPPFDPAQFPDCPVDAGGYDDYLGLELAGRIAVVLRHGPGDDDAIGEDCPGNDVSTVEGDLWTFGYKAANARAHNAAAMILIQDYHHPSAVVEGSIPEWYYDASFPVVSVDREEMEVAMPLLSDWANAIEENGLPNGQATGVSATVNVDAAVQEYVIPNLLGAIPGNDPVIGHEVIVIGAHVDHLGTDEITGDIYNGADDNASGTAVLMELARAFGADGFAPARTILFASFNAEEEGLAGSCYYTSDPVYPGEDVHTMISVDMVGAGDGQGLHLYGALFEDYLWLGDVMIGAAADAGLDYQVIPNIPVLASDHVCFIADGATAVMAETTGSHPVYHTPEDDIDHVSAGNLEAAAELLRVATLTIARGEEEQYLDTGEARRATAPPAPDPAPARRLTRSR